MESADGPTALPRTFPSHPHLPDGHQGLGSKDYAEQGYTASFRPFSQASRPSDSALALFQALQAVAAAHAPGAALEPQPLPPPQPLMTHSKPIPSADPLPQSPHRSDGSSERTGEACQQPLVNDIAVSSGAIAGVKLPITCNDIRGIAYMDQQVVACFCQGCSQRVAAGHDRPLFSFTRFERHSGSKAKKWRLSLRIDPGSIPECAAHEPPLPLGQWLDMRGLPNWAPRATMKVGRDSDEDGSGRFHRTSSGPGIWGPMAGVKRDRTEYETPDPPSLADQQAWLDEQIATFEAAAEEKDGQSAAAAQAGKHSAIFRLVYGLLAAGEERRAFNEDYLPWLNDLQQSRLETEFCTLHGYLRLVKEVGVDAAVGQSKAYLRSMLRRIAGSG